jgi:hypothetical protein
VLRFYYVCPENEEPIGVSIEVETIEEAEPGLHVEECPRCGEEHYLGLDDMYPGSGDDGATGVREPR